MERTKYYDKRIYEKDRAIKISIPLLTEEEMLRIDNDFDEIVKSFTKQVIKEKDLAISQYIINKQEKELEQKESILDKVTDFMNKIITKNVEKYNSENQKEVDFSEWNLALEILNIIEGEK